MSLQQTAKNMVIKALSYNLVRLLILISILLFVYQTINQKFDESRVRRVLPYNIDITETVMVSLHSGFWDGCGLGIFELSPNMLNRIKLDGIKALNYDEKDVKVTKVEWKENSYSRTNDKKHFSNYFISILNPQCSEKNMQLRRDISNEVLTGRIFYTNSKDHFGLIVIPKLKVVVYSEYWSH